MRTPELEKRHRASAKFSQMMLIVLKCLHEASSRKRNISAAMPAIHILLVIQLNDYRHRPPISQNKLHKKTGLHNKTVHLWLIRLIEFGAVEEKDGGYVGSDAFLEARLDAKYFQRIVRVICAAGRLLKD